MVNALIAELEAQVRARDAEILRLTERLEALTALNGKLFDLATRG